MIHVVTGALIVKTVIATYLLLLSLLLYVYSIMCVTMMLLAILLLKFII